MKYLMALAATVAALRMNSKAQNKQPSMLVQQDEAMMDDWAVASSDSAYVWDDGEDEFYVVVSDKHNDKFQSFSNGDIDWLIDEVTWTIQDALLPSDSYLSDSWAGAYSDDMYWSDGMADDWYSDSYWSDYMAGDHDWSDSMGDWDVMADDWQSDSYWSDGMGYEGMEWYSDSLSPDGMAGWDATGSPDIAAP